MATWTVTVGGQTVELEETFNGVTGVTGILYGLVGAYNEYQQFQKNFTRMKELAEAIAEINCERFDCWAEGPWAYLIGKKGTITGWQPRKASCEETFQTVAPFVDCALTAARQIERQLVSQYHGVARKDQSCFTRMESHLKATMAISLYRQKCREFEKDIDVKDKLMSSLYNSFRNLDSNASEAIGMMAQVQGYHSTVMASSLSNLSGHLGTVAAGFSALGGSTGG